MKCPELKTGRVGVVKGRWDVQCSGDSEARLSEHSLIQIMNLKLSSTLATLTLHSPAHHLCWEQTNLLISNSLSFRLSPSVLCWRQDPKLEKTHLVDHYQTGAGPSPGPGAGLSQTIPACHLLTTSTHHHPNDGVMSDTPLQYPSNLATTTNLAPGVYVAGHHLPLPDIYNAQWGCYWLRNGWHSLIGQEEQVRVAWMFPLAGQLERLTRIRRARA